MANEIAELTKAVVEFRDARDWRRFHNSKDLALAISIEAAELNELFLWKKSDEAEKQKIAEELGDVFIFGLLLAHENGFDVKRLVMDKLSINSTKYPVEKSKGSSRKYNEL